jgi:type IV pilus assembly protein PilV
VNPFIIKRKGQSGVMLLEAMIGILIFSLGILALIGMQVVATKSVTDSRNRAQATKLANDIIGDMWLANRASLATTYAYTGTGTAPSALTSWITQVQNTLPNVTTTTNLPIIAIAAPTGGLASAGGNEVQITIRWQPPGGTVHQFQTTAYIN